MIKPFFACGDVDDAAIDKAVLFDAKDLGMFIIEQIEIALKPKSRSFHLTTSEILSQGPDNGRKL